MNKLTRAAATLAIGAACALPALAQDTGTTATHGNTASEGVPTAQHATMTTPAAGINHTISASESGSASAPSTNTMGAGPEDTNRAAGHGTRDIGWMGLLGLFGLLGLRRRRPGHHAGMGLNHGRSH